MRRQAIRDTVVVLLAAAAGMAAVFQASALGLWAYALGAGAVAALVVAIWDLLVMKQAGLARSEEASWEEVRESLMAQQQQLDQREQDFASRLAVFHEWMEFPQPVDLAATPNSEELSELAEKDRELNRLLSETAEQVFRDIQDNRYAPDGQFDLTILRADVHALAKRVACLYSDDPDPSMLDASVEDVFRASSRACLQMLTVIDQMPLDIRTYTIENLYAYIRRAVTAYGAYRKAEPYLRFVNSAYFLGRLALGANPVSLGALWVMGHVGKRATQHVTTTYMNRQALAMLQQGIRVLGYEVANLYGAGFRYRDANWIYAAELTELLTVLPMSHRCLSQALQEVGKLPLRSEFDRVFLYRCIAERTTARPEQYAAVQVLNATERNAVASRLERFCSAFAGAASPAKLLVWREEAGQRLDVRLKVDGTQEADSESLAVESVRALMGLLVEFKQFEPEEAWDAILEAESYRSLSASQKQTLEQTWKAHPAYFFELPDLPPDSPLAKEFFSHAARMAVANPPRGPAIQQLIESVAVYLRVPEKPTREILTAACREVIISRWPDATKLDLHASLALLDILDALQSPPEFVAEVQGASSSRENNASQESLLLVGDDQQLIAYRVGSDSSEPVWRAPREALDVQKGGYLSGEVVLVGGEWLAQDAVSSGVDGDRPDTVLRIRLGRFSLVRSGDIAKELQEWRSSPGQESG